MLSIQVTNERQKAQIREHAGGPIDLGRGPQTNGVPRFMIEDIFVSRDQLQIEEKPGGTIVARNLSTRNDITLLNEGTILPAGGSREMSLPAVLSVGQTEIRVNGVNVAPPTPPPVEKPPPAPPERTPPPRPKLNIPEKQPAAQGESLQPEIPYARISSPVRSAQQAQDSVSNLGDSAEATQIAQWLQTIIELQRGETSLKDLYREIVQSMGQMIGLDLCLVLLRSGEKWKVGGSYVADDKVNVRWSQTLVSNVAKERETFYQDLRTLPVPPTSITDVEAVVVSPIYGLNDEVVAVLYGMRRKGVLQRGGIRPLEAQLVQLLAAAVGANMARTEAMQRRVQFEQFFSSELSRELERDPELLEGKNLEISVLFSDLRGFTSLMQRLGAQAGCRILRDIMERLSEQIVKNKGVIVDYAGDGILAMWNAPISQPDHAQLACEAALAMQLEMPGLNEKWKDLLDGGFLALGIGINTGTAQVGNTGSSRKFMYGPLGHTVNLASRVQDATKKLGLPILITGPTKDKLAANFATRRLGKVRVPGVSDPVDLYELHGKTADEDWLQRKDVYEQALEMYETRQWNKACQTLMPLLAQDSEKSRYEAPVMKLMRRAWECLEARPEPFDPVIEVTKKEM